MDPDPNANRKPYFHRGPADPDCTCQYTNSVPYNNPNRIRFADPDCPVHADTDAKRNAAAAARLPSGVHRPG